MFAEIRQLYENEHKQRMKECMEQCIKEHEKMRKESQCQLEEAKVILGAEKDKIVEELTNSLSIKRGSIKRLFMNNT